MPSAPNFLKALGSPKFIAAPMVHQSELAFRSLTRQNGCQLAFTQMIPAHKYATSHKFRENIRDWTTTHSNTCSSEGVSDRPLIVQLNGHDAESLVAAGKMIAATGVDAIDLNLGCPQNIAKRGNYGAYLLQDKTLSLQLLSAMASEIDCPVTVKIRLYDDPQDTVALCHSIEQCGIQMITVHGRTLHEKKQYVREANWTVLKDIKESGVTIPIVANGGVSCYADVIKCLEETKVDAVMSSEALLENPKLFSPKGDLDFRENYIQSQLVTIREYLSLVEQYPTPHSFITVVKAHLFKMMYRFITAPKNHDLRQTLGACQEYITMVKVVEEVERRVSVFAGHDLEAVGSGYLSSNTWYERHLLT